jgi:basic membrane lipoprotein Med (substrate-binding protein (PBP1-ABC) superfamily)|tara:strand:- start:8274 stop:9278 length:1005 start_codon:yes stop_codon:yes gene_type:complete
MRFSNVLKVLSACFLSFSVCFGAFAEMPKKVKMAAVLATGPDEPWDSSFLDSWKELAEKNDLGLELNEPVYTEGVWGDSAEAVMRLYARKYDVVWAHSSYSDQVKRLQKQYPETLFVVVGTGNEGLGGNQFWAKISAYRPAYLAGVMAGMETKSNVIGAVGTFATPDINEMVNAYINGAKSVNPSIDVKVAFIDSWWDPPMAFESSKAQIKAGADHILMMAHSFSACVQEKVACIGNYKDWSSFAPDSIKASLPLNWKPSIKWVLNEWKQAKNSGQPFNGNIEPKYSDMRDGSSAFVLGSMPVSDSTKAKLNEVESKLRSGELVIIRNSEKPTP